MDSFFYSLNLYLTKKEGLSIEEANEKSTIKNIETGSGISMPCCVCGEKPTYFFKEISTGKTNKIYCFVKHCCYDCISEKANSEFIKEALSIIKVGKSRTVEEAVAKWNKKQQFISELMDRIN